MLELNLYDTVELKATDALRAHNSMMNSFEGRLLPWLMSPWRFNFVFISNKTFLICVLSKISVTSGQTSSRRVVSSEFIQRYPESGSQTLHLFASLHTQGKKVTSFQSLHIFYIESFRKNDLREDAYLFISALQTKSFNRVWTS